MANIADLRRDYKLKSLEVADVDSNPIQQFKVWFDEAIKSDVLEPNAMILATASDTGFPNARVLLLKGVEEQGFIFFTNYESEKGKELAANPAAAMVFNWLDLERQVRIRGKVVKISEEESTNYFQSRPKDSQIGAWASPQSRVIKSREVLEQNQDFLREEYKKAFVLPRPDNWGGYCLIPSEIEFWQGRSSRLHDRILYTKFNESEWKIERLAP
jgi:pyridoxamine 5'-phosphate oxidase